VLCETHAAKISTLALAFALSGCLSANGFGVARTVLPKEVSHAAGLTGFAAREDSGDDILPGGGVAYALRVGLADRLDLGAAISFPAQMRVDLKYNPLRTTHFDLAVAPAAWLAYYPLRGDETPIIVGADVPVLIGINPTETVTLIPSLGPGVLVSPSNQQRAFYLRGCLGARFRLGETLALHPELTMMWDPGRGTFSDAAFGLGLVFGTLP
jgi:hypothetical protein